VRQKEDATTHKESGVTYRGDDVIDEAVLYGGLGGASLNAAALTLMQQKKKVSTFR